jgi:multidrug efflux pump subunit AcrA (membrane-fusion protein)
MKKINYFLGFLVCLTLLSSCGKKQDRVKPERKDITEAVFASGVLLPENLYNLTAQNDGYLVKLDFKEGDVVQAGEVLAIIENKQIDYSAQSANAILSIANANISSDAPALKQAEANLLQAKQQLAQNKKQTDRYQKLYETQSVSKLDFENAQLAFENAQSSLMAAQENLNLLKQQAQQDFILQKSQADINNLSRKNNEICAVIGGTIYNKYKQLGDYVRKGDIIAEIGSTQSFYAKLNIDESQISKISPEQPVVLQFNTNKNRNLRGVVDEIYPAFDEQTQSFYVKALFTDSLDFKVSGTQLQANIITAERKDVLVIPRSYLGYGNKVKTKTKGIATVQTGFISTDWVEITAGLDENTIIELP